MPWRPTAKSSYLTKIHFQGNFFSSSQLNQFTALSSFYLVVNKDRLNFAGTVGRGMFYISIKTAISVDFGWVANALMMLSMSDKKTCMIQVSFPQTCRDMQVSYVPSAAHLSVCWFGSALPSVRPAIFAPVQFHKNHNLIKEFPKVKHEEEGESGFSFLSQWSVWTVMAFTCWDKSSNTPYSKWPQCQATVPTVCTVTAV